MRSIASIVLALSVMTVAPIAPIAPVVLGGEAQIEKTAPAPDPVAPPSPTVATATPTDDPDACTEDFTGRNVTTEFRERFANIDKYCTEDRKEALKPYNVIIVHGLLGEVGLKFTGFLNTFSREQTCIDYFKDQRRAVEEFGVEPNIPGFKSASIDRSGTKIAQAIADSDRPVVLISHSKGGIDTLDALLKLQKQGKLNKVAGWISIQGCFYGSPDADSVENSKFRKPFSFVALKCLGANWDAVRDLTTTSSAAYHETHRDEIASVLHTVPTICFASWTDKADKNDPEHKSDGCVPLRSAVLPNTDYIAKSGVTHGMTVIRSSEKFDRERFTKVLLTMLVDKMKQTAPKEGGALKEVPALYAPEPVQAANAE